MSLISVVFYVLGEKCDIIVVGSVIVVLSRVVPFR
jgi:hypothetical protein